MTGLISTHIKGERLQEYAAMLIDNGFSIRVVNALDGHGNQIPTSWFVYERDGWVGVVQRELLDSYSHSMPVRPTRDDGSAIHMFDASNELHLAHAVKTAQPENRGQYNGMKKFKNDGLTRFEQYVVVEKDPTRVVPIRVVWQEVTQYDTVLEIPVDKGMMGTKAGRRRVRELINEKLDDLTEEQLLEAFDTEWNGPLRHIDKMEPIWDAIEPAKKA